MTERENKRQKKMGVKCSGVRRAGGRRGRAPGCGPGWGVMEQGEISRISRGRRDAEETPRVGAVTGQQAAPPLVRGKPSVLQRQTVTSPWRCSVGGSSGNAGPPDLLTSDFPSRSSPAPKDRRHGTDTLCFPATCSRACTRVCKDPLYSTGWAQALSCTPLPELPSQLWRLYWT